MVRMVKASIALLAMIAVGWWLIADTVRYLRSDPAAMPLRVSFWGTFEEYRMWQELAAAFQKRHPGVALKLEYLPGARYEVKVGQQLVAESAADVILYQDEPFFALVDEGNFVDVGPRLADLVRAEGGDPGADLHDWLTRRFWPTAVDSFGEAVKPAAGGAPVWRQYGMPIWGGCNLIYANKALFAKARIRIGTLPGPAGLQRDGDGWILDDQRWTVDDFHQVARLLTVDTDGDGFIEQFGYTGSLFHYWQPFHQTMGATTLDATRTHTLFHGPAVERSLQLIQDWRWDDAKRIEPRDELGEMNNAVAFLCGRAAMFNSGPWEMPFLNFAKVDYRILHFPRHPEQRTRSTRITWDAVALNARSRHPQQAWDLIRFLSLDPEAHAIIARVQRALPAMRSAAPLFSAGNPRVDPQKFVEAVGDYAEMQPIPRVDWNLMAEVWMQSMAGLRHPIRERRMTPTEAIGLFYSDEALRRRLPPADPVAAEPYCAAYRAYLARVGR